MFIIENQLAIRNIIKRFARFSRNFNIHFTGSYQVSQAICHLEEMLKENNSIKLSYHITCTKIVRFEVKSTHIMISKTYKTFLVMMLLM